MENLVVVKFSFLIVLFTVFSGLSLAEIDRRQQTKSNMKSLSISLDIYKIDIGDFPCGKEPLQLLTKNVMNNKKWLGPYINPSIRNLVFMDGWNRDLVYIYSCESSPDTYKLYSIGQNGIDEKGSGDDMVHNSSN